MSASPVKSTPAARGSAVTVLVAALEEARDPLLRELMGSPYLWLRQAPADRPACRRVGPEPGRSHPAIAATPLHLFEVL
jgi:hypothetical protein